MVIFIGYFIIYIHHKTLPFIRQLRFYLFEETTSPPILLLYPASERLGIIEFKVPNEAPTTATIDTISTEKKVTFSKPLHASRTKHSKRSSNVTIRVSHKKTNLSKTIHHHTIHPLQNYSAIENKPFQDLHYRTICCNTTPHKTIHFRTISH